MTSMPPATGPALIILVAFVLPGFVTVLLQERTFKSADDPTPLDRLLRIAMYSVLSYLLIAIAAIVGGFNRTKILNDYHHYTADPAQLVWRGVVLVVIPSLIIATATFGWSRFKHREAVMEFFKLNPRHTEPTAWDHFFRKRRRCFVRATFADGRRVLGFYGSDSFASFSKDGRDLWLEQVYTPNNTRDYWFGAEVLGSCGVWINTAEAVHVEFYADLSDGAETKQATAAAPGVEEVERASGSAETASTTEATAASTPTAGTAEGEVDEQRRAD